jgi:hypothetical protein
MAALTSGSNGSLHIISGAVFLARSVIVLAFSRRRSLLMCTKLWTISSGAVDSFRSGVFSTIGGTTRATQLSTGMVLRENGFGNGMWSSVVTARLPAGSRA